MGTLVWDASMGTLVWGRWYGDASMGTLVGLGDTNISYNIRLSCSKISRYSIISQYVT